MSNKVEVQTRNIRLTDKIEEYVNKKAGNFDHYLTAIEEARVELAHYKAARNADDRNVAQITVYGKGFTLRTEERADEAEQVVRALAAGSTPLVGWPAVRDEEAPLPGATERQLAMVGIVEQAEPAPAAAPG